MTNKKEKQLICPKCGCEIEKEVIYCPECGVNIKEYIKKNAAKILFSKKHNIIAIKNKENETDEPKMKGRAILLIVIFLILFFPLGIIIAIFEYLNLSKKRKDWRNQQLINAIENKP